jgi:glycosyltransferase involved in cell wall biosynthesis
MNNNKQPILLVLTSYPNRECGIATFSNDLVQALKVSYLNEFEIKICAIENGASRHEYDQDVLFTLNAFDRKAYKKMALDINMDDRIAHVLIQHEFGLFGGDYGSWIKLFIRKLERPFSIAFHTVLPNPEARRYRLVRFLAEHASACIVMTNHAKELLRSTYQVLQSDITIIPHGTHTMISENPESFREINDLSDKIVLSTFGLLSSNKSIETALLALPEIIRKYPNVMYVILGKTHPEVVKHEGEKYRNYLESIIYRLNLSNNVKFVNKFLPNEELLQWLQVTDVYLFTSRDPHQAVSGTFAYAMSSGCPIIATSIPHATECLSTGAGRLIDFESPDQLGFHLNELLSDQQLRQSMRNEALHYMKPTEWQNVAINYLKILPSKYKNNVQNLPPIRLKHLHKLMGEHGIFQFAPHGIPDKNSGYTLDDNARGLIACCAYVKLKKDPSVLLFIDRFLSFISHCQVENGQFINYVDENGNYSLSNKEENLEDANGRAVWALGVVLSIHELLPKRLIEKAWRNLQCYLENDHEVSSPRALAFHIKGIHHLLDYTYNSDYVLRIEKMANELKESFMSTKSGHWNWFEDQLTYGNGVLPEAMALAYHRTKMPVFKTIAHMSFEFLLDHLFDGEQFNPISNKGWHHRTSDEKAIGGYQPIDVAYTILALDTFHTLFNRGYYLSKMQLTFQWFLGHNHLHQLVYNSETGGCHDGLEETNINLNQGAESTVCYLLSRLTLEKYTQYEPIKSPTSRIRKEEISSFADQPSQFTFI